MPLHETVIRTAAEGICVCHACDAYPFVRFSVWNDRMTAITGYSMAAINRLGWYQSVYLDEAIRAKAIDRMERMRQGGDLQSEEWEISRRLPKQNGVPGRRSTAPRQGCEGRGSRLPDREIL